jgi:hypothetical protein
LLFSTVAAQTVSLFDGVGIQFGGDANWSSQPGTTRLDNGRIIERTITLPEIPANARVSTQLNIWASDDPWDRAGNIELVTAAGSVELHKFITGFGGTTSHQQDITNLIPLLRQGPVKVRAFVDTWVQEAWTLDFDLKIEADDAANKPVWNRPVFNDQDWRANDFANNRRSHSVAIPAGMDEVFLSYITSGHASDGSGGDEFTQRRHRIWIDGVEVFNEIPWRTDGRNFRDVNPYSGRWGDIWSSDLQRSGWIPGDDVDPYLIDVSQYLTQGRHTIEYEIEGIETDDGDGYGYWRTSSYLTGFQSAEPDADFDGDGDIDGRDFLIWQRGFGLSNQLNNTKGDANRDGTVTEADLAEWSLQYRAAAALGTSIAVPEPLTLAPVAIFCTLLLSGRRLSRRIYICSLSGGSS